MIEVERKYRVTEQQADAIAEKVGAAPPAEQLDEVYLLHSDSWDGFVSGQPVIRLRSVDGAIRLAVKTKGPTGTHEVEIDVPDSDQARPMVELLGGTPVTRIHKTRRSGDFRGHVIAIDHVADLGHFVEIETIVRSEEEAARALPLIGVVGRALGLVDADEEPDKYDTLIERRRRAVHATS